MFFFALFIWIAILPPSKSLNSITIVARDSQQWFLRFIVKNANVSCGGNISKAEISDHFDYKNTWHMGDIHWYSGWIDPEFQFHKIDQTKYTVPISVRITRTDLVSNISEEIVSHDVITHFTDNITVNYDFGTNFCRDSTSFPTFLPTTSPVSSATTLSPTSTTDVDVDKMNTTDLEEISTTYIDEVVHDSNGNGSFLTVLYIGAAFVGSLIFIFILCVCYKKHSLQKATVFSIDYDVNSGQMKQWLNGFGMGQYHDTLVENGFTSLECIKRIKSENDLVEIGITLKGHRVVIMSEIDKMNNVQDSVAEHEGVKGNIHHEPGENIDENSISNKTDGFIGGIEVRDGSISNNKTDGCTGEK